MSEFLRDFLAEIATGFARNHEYVHVWNAFATGEFDARSMESLRACPCVAAYCFMFCKDVADLIGDETHAEHIRHCFFMKDKITSSVDMYDISAHYPKLYAPTTMKSDASLLHKIPLNTPDSPFLETLKDIPSDMFEAFIVVVCGCFSEDHSCHEATCQAFADIVYANTTTWVPVFSQYDSLERMTNVFRVLEFFQGATPFMAWLDTIFSSPKTVESLFNVTPIVVR